MDVFHQLYISIYLCNIGLYGEAQDGCRNKHEMLEITHVWSDIIRIGESSRPAQPEHLGAQQVASSPVCVDTEPGFKMVGFYQVGVIYMCVHYG